MNRYGSEYDGDWRTCIWCKTRRPSAALTLAVVDGLAVVACVDDEWCISQREVRSAVQGPSSKTLAAESVAEAAQAGFSGPTTT